MAKNTINTSANSMAAAPRCRPPPTEDLHPAITVFSPSVLKQPCTAAERMRRPDAQPDPARLARTLRRAGPSPQTHCQRPDPRRRRLRPALPAAERAELARRTARRRADRGDLRLAVE